MSQSEVAHFNTHQRTAAILQVFVSFNFSIVMASLFLYLTQVLSLSTVDASELMGLYFAVNYLFHLVSGCLNKYGLSLCEIACVALFFQASGFIGLLFFSTRFTVVSCLCLSIGFGLMVPVINLLLARRESTSFLQREKAYFINYGVLSLGFLLGYTVVGYGQMTQHVAWAYDLGLINVVLLGFSFIRLRRYFPDSGPVKRSFGSRLKLLILLGAFFVMAYMVDLRHFQQLCSLLMLALMTILAFAIFFGLRSQRDSSMGRYGLFLLFNGVALVYFISQVMVSTLMMAVLNQWVDRHVFGVIIPPAWVDNVAGVVAITLCPFLGCVFYRYQSRHGVVSPWVKLFVGFIFAALSYAVMSLGCLWLTRSGHVALLPATLFFVFHAVAAILISPVLYSLVTAYVPEDGQSLAMGMVCCNQGLGAFIASYFVIVTTKQSLIAGTLTLVSIRGLFNNYSIVLLLTALLCLVMVVVGQLAFKKNRLSRNTTTRHFY